MVEEQVLQKIKKVMALADDAGATEGEREAALKKAYTIMAKYGIEQDKIDFTDEDDFATADVEEQVRILTWRKLLAGVIRKNFPVEVYTYHSMITWYGKRRRGKIVKIYGKKKDVEIATYMYQQIVNQAFMLYRQAAEKNGWKRGYGRNDYFLGVVKYLDDMFKKTREDIKAETGMEVVLRKPKVPGLVNTPYSVRSGDGRARGNGYSDAKNIQLRKGVRDTYEPVKQLT